MYLESQKILQCPGENYVWIKRYIQLPACGLVRFYIKLSTVRPIRSIIMGIGMFMWFWWWDGPHSKNSARVPPVEFSLFSFFRDFSQLLPCVFRREKCKRQTVRLQRCHFKKQTGLISLSLSTLITALLHTYTLWCPGLYESQVMHTVKLALCALCLTFAFSISSFLLPSLLLSFSLCLFTPPLLPAVFAGSFSARHPEAAVAPASLPTSVFVVGDDMSKLWRAGEGRERGREREGREGAHHSPRRKSKGPRENVMWPAARPDILFLPLSLSRAVYVGRQERRQEAAPLRLLPPPFILSFSSSLTRFSCLPLSPPPLFPHPHPTFDLAFSLPSLDSVLLCEFPGLHFPPLLLSVWLPPPPHPQACLCIITHLVLKCVEVCWGVNCEWVVDKTCLISEPWA